MKLINTDGMAFIGPGSEWFWTAISGIVLAVTFLAIFRQLQLARSEGAIEQLASFDREWGDERNARHQLNVLIALKDGADLADVAFGSTQAIGNFWERVASLARGGHIDPKLLWNGSGRDCVTWWITLGPFVRWARAAEGDSTVFEHFEWLAGVMSEMDRQAGSLKVDEETVAGWIDRRISARLDRIRVEQELRSVIIASPETLTAVQPPVAVGAPAAPAQAPQS